MPGMITEVVLRKDTEKDACYIIPANIVQLDEKNNNFVWIEKDGKASKQIIKCGEFTPKGVTVVSGLQNGTQVIVEGQQKVCEGTSLTII